MNGNRGIAWLLRGYSALVFLFIFAPIISGFIFSFNAGRFPSLPWGGFSTAWYGAVFADAEIGNGLRRSLIVGMSVAAISTFIGFATAYTDYRFKFFGKNVYLALAFLPPTIPVIILGLAMLVFLSQIGLSGHLYSVILAHVSYCAPFAMALIRLRLSQIDPNLEPAAWNLGASQWRALCHVILPFALPAILSALFITMAVSFDEFAIAWFVSGFDETLPVRILVLLQREVSPRVNALGSLAFGITMTLVILAQVLILARRPGGKRQLDRG
jgi:spermidine/putrescine transport system permease protein